MSIQPELKATSTLSTLIEIDALNQNDVISTPTYDFIADQLAEKGFCILSDVFSTELLNNLHHRVTRIDDDEFQLAGIGRDQQFQLNKRVRLDETRWLSESHSVDQAYLQQMSDFRLAINRRLFMGLFDYEAHYAHYAPGAFYQRHVDAFKGQSNRVLTTVLYLNPHWQADFGGQLHIYQPDSESVLQTVQPELGTFVVFLSEQFPHEVVESQQDRYSIAGWFRVQDPLQAPSI